VQKACAGKFRERLGQGVLTGHFEVAIGTHDEYLAPADLAPQEFEKQE
jgi:hypothetical protein